MISTLFRLVKSKPFSNITDTYGSWRRKVWIFSSFLTDRNEIDKAILELEAARMAVDIVIGRARDGNCDEIYQNVQELGRQL